MSAMTDDGLVEMTWTARCKPDTVWVVKPPLFPFILAAIVFMICGGVIGAALRDSIRWSDYAQPIELSETERSYREAIVETNPNVMILRIVDGAKFDEIKPTPNTIAFASISTFPCEITIPAGYKIRFAPKEKTARFENQENANTVAHEILHCLRGSWHP